MSVTALNEVSYFNHICVNCQVSSFFYLYRWKKKCLQLLSPTRSNAAQYYNYNCLDPTTTITTTTLAVVAAAAAVVVVVVVLVEVVDRTIAAHIVPFCYF